jgi:hypothetical protein
MVTSHNRLESKHERERELRTRVKRKRGIEEPAIEAGG